MPGAFWRWRNSQRPLRAFRFPALPVLLYPENLLQPIGMVRPKEKLLYSRGLLKKKTFPSSIRGRESLGQPSRALLPFLLKNHSPVDIGSGRRLFRSNKSNPNNGIAGLLL